MGAVVERHISVAGEDAGGAFTRADVHVTQDVDADCFSLDMCDECERALIAAIRSYLRPQTAPEALLRRLHATLDHCCLCDEA